MKRLFSARYTAAGINTGTLLLRLGLGILMLNHGYQKLSNFSEFEAKFMDFMGLGSTISLALCVFAEFFCSLFLILGLFTRLSCIPLIINAIVIVFVAHNQDFFGKGELGTLYLAGYIALFFTGPGKISIDGLIFK
jgi:putative oxidoreductase